MINRLMRSLLILCSLGFVSSCFAVMVNVTGAVVIPPCQIVNINGSMDPVNIDFGDIAIRKIDGTEYTQTVPWKLHCDEYDLDGMEKMYKLQVNAPATDFDQAAITTTTDDLGIRFMFGSSALPIGKPSDEFYQTALLRVVPVIKAGAEPTAGTFTASASLLLIIP